MLDRIRVESFLKEWIGSPNLNERPVGWNGMGAPSTNAQVLVYLTGSKSTGFKFVEPNGALNVQRLRENSTLLQSHLSNEEWETVERNIGNVPPVKPDSIVNAFSLTVLLLFVAIAILIALWNLRSKTSHKVTQTNVG